MGSRLPGGEPHVATLVIPAAIAGVSIVVFVLSLRRPKAWAARLEAFTPSATARSLGIVYLVLAAAALGSAGVAAFGTDGNGPNSALGGLSTAALLVTELPWSHPVFFVAYLAIITGQL